jgi:hypothetical protein
MDSHGVSLPHPRQEGDTTGRCDCGWTVIYGWGRHNDAAEMAAEHIQQAALATPIEVLRFSGERMLIPGRSL